MRNPLRTEFTTRHYRQIIFTLVLLNAALLVFLIVYFWSYGGEYRGRDSQVEAGSSFETRPAVVTADNVIAWNKPGGVSNGGASRGILERGHPVKVLSSRELEGRLWFRIEFDRREGWVEAGELKFIQAEK